MRRTLCASTFVWLALGAGAGAQDAASAVLGKADITLRQTPACEITFRYGEAEPETLFWEEPCSAVTAKMVDRAELQSLGRWERLDSFAQDFVGAMPGGLVLYVEGSFSAAVYPVGTTGLSYEVPVAD